MESSDQFIQDYMSKNTFEGLNTSQMPESMFYNKNGVKSLRKPLVAPNPKGKYIFEPQKGIDDFSSDSSSSSGDIDDSSSESDKNAKTVYTEKLGPKLEEFTLGKSSQTVKIDFEKANKNTMGLTTTETHQDLKTSCLCLIDQLAHYYDNFYDNMKMDG